MLVVSEVASGRNKHVRKDETRPSPHMNTFLAKYAIQYPGKTKGVFMLKSERLCEASHSRLRNTLKNMPQLLAACFGIRTSATQTRCFGMEHVLCKVRA